MPVRKWMIDDRLLAQIGRDHKKLQGIVPSPNIKRIGAPRTERLLVQITGIYSGSNWTNFPAEASYSAVQVIGDSENVFDSGTLSSPYVWGDDSDSNSFPPIVDLPSLDPANLDSGQQRVPDGSTVEVFNRGNVELDLTWYMYPPISADAPPPSGPTEYMKDLYYLDGTFYKVLQSGENVVTQPVAECSCVAPLIDCTSIDSLVLGWAVTGLVFDVATGFTFAIRDCQGNGNSATIKTIAVDAEGQLTAVKTFQPASLDRSGFNGTGIIHTTSTSRYLVVQLDKTGGSAPNTNLALYSIASDGELTEEDTILVNGANALHSDGSYIWVATDGGMRTYNVVSDAFNLVDTDATYTNLDAVAGRGGFVFAKDSVTPQLVSFSQSSGVISAVDALAFTTLPDTAILTPPSEDPSSDGFFIYTTGDGDLKTILVDSSGNMVVDSASTTSEETAYTDGSYLYMNGLDVWTFDENGNTAEIVDCAGSSPIVSTGSFILVGSPLKSYSYGTLNIE